MSLRQFRDFVGFVDAGSFSRVAARLQAPIGRLSALAIRAKARPPPAPSPDSLVP